MGTEPLPVTRLDYVPSASDPRRGVLCIIYGPVLAAYHAAAVAEGVFPLTLFLLLLYERRRRVQVP